MLPSDYLVPIWRCYPNGNGVAAIGLDPREAEFVLERGFAVLDGERWQTVPIGPVDQDGRIPIRVIREATCA